MNIGEVGSTTYDSPAGISNQYERLGREHLHANDRKSGLYLDLDNKTVEETDQVKHSARDSEEMDSVYNTIDEQVPTGHGDDNVNQTKLPSDSGDINTATANYFILEKHEEEKTSETAEVLTEDPNPTEDYFVLDKDENQAKSEPTDNHPDSGITVVNRSDNYSISEEQQSPENQTSDNYFLLEEENNGNLKEDAPDDDKYDVLNKDTNDETSEYYSHAKTVESSQESTSRDENLHENNENYDKMFQRPNSNVIHDSDSDYDHMNNDDLLTSL
ncbi:protein IWS1 homolog [Ylistrum balloti]|uniref:protein IWS1 homolog n=1 Tax=Ylistrum balloti TaxID=509963 RepID=UPI002905BF5D|nr:protein IWS1 homolog [Ylistrum balloti]